MEEVLCLPLTKAGGAEGQSSAGSLAPPPPSLLRVSGAGSAASAAAGGGNWQSQYWQEVQRRAAAEAALRELQLQLGDVWTVLQESNCSASSSTAGPCGDAARPAPAAAVATALEAAAAAAAAEAADRLTVARMVAGILGHTAATADLKAGWERDRELLQRRLDQAASMSAAMLRRQQAASADPEPWRHQLLNGLLSAGCLALGAAAAVAIVSKAHAH